MNYLAHTVLSADPPEQIMGNMWGDILRPQDYPSLDPNVMLGIKRHKIIDAYTDQHPAVDTMIRLVRPFQGKYTPVVTDVLMDFMLCKYWDRFYPDTIESFCEKQYAMVSAYLYLIPERLHPRIQRMLSHRWLESCKNRERLTDSLHMLSRRASFDNHMKDALIAYDLHEAVMDEMFLSFFVELRQHVNLQNEG